MREMSMHFFHHCVAIRPSVSKSGNTFVARLSILEEDGEATSHGELGRFANRESAFAFAVRCGIAFVDDERLPIPPVSSTTECQSLHVLNGDGTTHRYP